MAGTLALTGWVGQTVSADPPSTDPAVAVTKTNLPAGWDAAPIGIVPDTINEKQSVSVDSKGVWSIVAGGFDLWANDDGGLLVYTKHTGDGSVSFHLLTQSLGDGNGWVKTAAGFRETLDSGSRDVHLSYTSANLCEPAVRVTMTNQPLHPSEQTGSNGVGFWGAGGGARPDCGRMIGSGIWVGVDRVGDKFGYYWSDDGKIWNTDATDTIHLPADLLAGIEATKHNVDPTADTNKSTLDNVNVSNDLLGPHAISNVTYTPQDKAAIVTWNPVTDSGVTYNVYQYTMPDISDAKKINTAPITTASFMVENLTNGTPYKFAVTAVLNGTESAKAVPEPTMGNNNSASDNTGVVVPNAPIAALGGLVVYNVGTDTPGTVTLTSGTDLASAAIHMKASGFDIWEAGDGFSFLAMPMAGDLDVSARFVKGPTEDADGGGWELGGPMFRETLDSGSRFAMAQLAATNDLQFKRRDVVNTTPSNTDLSGTGGIARPITMRVVRKGDTFQAYYSMDDGKTWKDFGDPKSTDPTMSSIDTIKGFAKMPYVGIALSGHTEGEISEADIDHIVIKPAQ
jgi:hypothetical protein